MRLRVSPCAVVVRRLDLPRIVAMTLCVFGAFRLLGLTACADSHSIQDREVPAQPVDAAQPIVGTRPDAVTRKRVCWLNGELCGGSQKSPRECPAFEPDEGDRCVVPTNRTYLRCYYCLPDQEYLDSERPHESYECLDGSFRVHRTQCWVG